MRTPTTVRDHPIHPMLIVFPLGLWYFSLICQIIYLIFGGAHWLTVAYYAAAGGIVGAILAAIPGFIDLFSMNDRRAKNIGITHMVLNLIGVGAWAVVFYLLSPNVNNIDLALYVSIGAAALLFYSGWLGGDMVHRYRVAVVEEYERESVPSTEQRVRTNPRKE